MIKNSFQTSIRVLIVKRLFYIIIISIFLGYIYVSSNEQISDDLPLKFDNFEESSIVTSLKVEKNDQNIFGDDHDVEKWLQSSYSFSKEENKHIHEDFAVHQDELLYSLPVSSFGDEEFSEDNKAHNDQSEVTQQIMEEGTTNPDEDSLSSSSLADESVHKGQDYEETIVNETGVSEADILNEELLQENTALILQISKLQSELEFRNIELKDANLLINSLQKSSDQCIIDENNNSNILQKRLTELNNQLEICKSDLSNSIEQTVSVEKNISLFEIKARIAKNEQNLARLATDQCLVDLEVSKTDCNDRVLVLQKDIDNLRAVQDDYRSYLKLDKTSATSFQTSTDQNDNKVFY